VLHASWRRETLDSDVRPDAQAFSLSGRKRECSDKGDRREAGHVLP
jgi:hypothetical protein